MVWQGASGLENTPQQEVDPGSCSTLLDAGGSPPARVPGDDSSTLCGGSWKFDKSSGPR